MKTILLTGATGLIGKELGLALVRKGYTLIGLTRNIQKAKLQAPYPSQWIECDIEKSSPDLSEFQIDAVIHLAGEGIAEKSWSQEQKNKILSSRVQGTKNLAAAIKAQKQLKAIVGASAIGIYRPTNGDEIADENFEHGRAFLSEVTEKWEESSSAFSQLARTVIYRIGVVLSNEGGALPKMTFPAKIFASSRIGSGEQWMSWIHIDDVVDALIAGIEKKNLNGTYNLVAPEPAQQSDFAKLIAKSMKALSGPPIPSFMLQIMLGEQAQLVTTSLKISSQKLSSSGFVFRFANLAEALDDLLSPSQEGKTVLVFKQYFALPREKVFHFFCDAGNLEKITPPSLNFKILSMSTPQIQAGTLINYKLKIHGVPIHWTTQIETWEKNIKFTDTQLKGPYSLWHHTHLFEDLAEGTLMTDVLIYKLPLMQMGRTAAQALVDKDVESIFKFRRECVEKYL